MQKVAPAESVFRESAAAAAAETLSKQLSGLRPVRLNPPLYVNLE